MMYSRFRSRHDKRAISICSMTAPVRSASLERRRSTRLQYAEGGSCPVLESRREKWIVRNATKSSRTMSAKAHTAITLTVSGIAHPLLFELRAEKTLPPRQSQCQSEFLFFSRSAFSSRSSAMSFWSISFAFSILFYLYFFPLARLSHYLFEFFRVVFGNQSFDCFEARFDSFESVL